MADLRRHVRHMISAPAALLASTLTTPRLQRDPRRPRVLILVENLAVPFDRRVWQEALSLRDAGYDVNVICPRSAQHPTAHEVLEGVHIYRYASPVEARRTAGYLVEYPLAFAAQLALAVRVHLGGRIDVIQACNPPDLMFLVALPFRLFGTRFLFDHHDACPELLVAKGKAWSHPLVRLMTRLERLTFAAATVSIATNESYRRIAVERGRMSPDDVFVVRSAPTVERFAGARVDPSFRRGKRHLVAYVGVMGIQEGLDHLLDAVDVLVNRHGRDDMQVCLAGSGPERARLEGRVHALGLDGHVDFLGRISDEDLGNLLATADVCVNPDEVNEMNDISTMNKILEYMALGKPIVQFDLTEGRVSAGEASLYARPNDAESLADCIASLLEAPGRRARMGALGRRRFQELLSWEHSVPSLLAAYEQATRRGAAPTVAPVRVPLSVVQPQVLPASDTLPAA
ncbi:glycosyltransferase family 4 protein [Georgenia alba]|uniref:Glycosyltransferase family 4 protein n=1 Tax=Georgenia alba TaxID=2233858 RepID=A0ABW2Q5Y2_9MICO